MKTFYAELHCGSSSVGVSVCVAGGYVQGPLIELSLGSVNVIDGRQQFLASLLVYM